MKLIITVFILVTTVEVSAKEHKPTKIYDLESSKYMGCLVAPQFLDKNIHEKDCIPYISEFKKESKREELKQKNRKLFGKA